MTDGNKTIYTIFVELLDEDIEVWRPVPACRLESGYELMSTPDYDPTDESWRFPPGSVVHVEERELNGEPALVAIAEIFD